MKKLLYTFLVLLIVVAAGLAAAPYWFGMQTEQAYNRLLEELEIRGTVVVRQNDYRRGWLSSRVDTMLELMDRPVQFQLTHTISHGPLPLDDLDKLIERARQLEPVQAVADTRTTVTFAGGSRTLPAIETRTEVGFDGEAKSRFTFPRSKGDFGDGGTIDIGRLTGDAWVDLNTLALRSRFAAKSFGIQTAAGGGFQASQLTARYSGDGSAESGDLEVEIESMTVEGPRASDELTVGQVKISSLSESAKGQVSYDFAMSAASLTVDETLYGPAKLTLRLEGLDADAVAEVRASADGEAGASLLALMNLATSGQPRLDLGVAATTPDGEIRGSGVLAVAGLEPGTSNPFDVLGAIQMEAEAAFPSSVVEKALERKVRDELKVLATEGKIPELTDEQQQTVLAKAIQGRINQLVSSGKLVRADGDRFEVRGTYRDGTLVVNDEPMPVSLPFGS